MGESKLATKNPHKNNPNSHRPFLCIDVINLPAKGARTERAGWANDPRNWNSGEQSYVVDRVTPKIAARATIIIDLLESRMVKCRMDVGNADSSEVMAFYRNKYSDKVSQSIDIWLSRKKIEEAIKTATLA